LSRLFVFYTDPELERITDSEIEDHILPAPFTIAERYLIYHPPVIFGQPRFAQRYCDVKAQY
jgi:hypothetical protein